MGFCLPSSSWRALSALPPSSSSSLAQPPEAWRDALCFALSQLCTENLLALSAAKRQSRRKRPKLITHICQNFSNSRLKICKRLNGIAVNFNQRKSESPLRCHGQNRPPPRVPCKLGRALQVWKFGASFIFRELGHPLYAILAPTTTNLTRQRF